MHLFKTFGHVGGGIFLIAGTSIGVGMLGLPSATASSGFFPSVIIYIACWLFMFCTGLLVLEACSWMPKGANLITLSKRLLGKKGEYLCWALYLFLFLCLMVAHTATGGDLLHQILGFSLSSMTIFYVILFFPVVYLGAHTVDRLNLIFMMIILIAYALFVFPALKQSNLSYLQTINWTKAIYALPMIFTAFGYQSLIPTLYNYMNRDKKKVRLSIIIGTLIPLVLYILWNGAILGTIPLQGPNGLMETFTSGKTVFNSLGYFLSDPRVVQTGKIFAFFAATTSYMGIAISFRDFLSDGLKTQGKNVSKWLICCFIFLIPLCVVLINPSIFFKALEYAGGIGVVLLLGVMPIAWVWRGRYQLKLSSHHQLLGGKLMLYGLSIFAVFELSLEIIHLVK